jgi:hypothetical protein
MNQFESWAIAYAKDIWAGVGPLVGVLMGGYITNRNQRKQRIIDSKKEEYRELLESMSKAMSTFFFDRARLLPSGTDRVTLLATTSSNVMEIIQTRIFIAPVMTELTVLPRWRAALELPQRNEADTVCADHWDDTRRYT